MKNLFDFYTSAGLSSEQAVVYDILLKHRRLPASRVSRLCNIERSFAYKILNQLIEIKLAQKTDEKGKISTFSAEHPKRLIELVEEKRLALENSQNQITAGIGKLISEYNLTLGKPNVSFIEGERAIIDMHSDITKENKDIKLFRSVFDKVNSENRELIHKQRAARVPRGLKTKIIGPLPGKLTSDSTPGEIKVQKDKDNSLLVERRIVDNFEIPAQILIYGNKVAITDYSNNIITTIIDSENVRKSFEAIFDRMFETGRKL